VNLLDAALILYGINLPEDFLPRPPVDMTPAWTDGFRLGEKMDAIEEEQNGKLPTL
jgi:hypothetical protein